MPMNISHINMCKWDKNRERRKELEIGVRGDGLYGCSFGEHLDNRKPVRPLYIFKYMLSIISVCSFEVIGLQLIKSLRSIAQSLGSQLIL